MNNVIYLFLKVRSFYTIYKMSKDVVKEIEITECQVDKYGNLKVTVMTVPNGDNLKNLSANDKRILLRFYDCMLIRSNFQVQYDVDMNSCSFIIDKYLYDTDLDSIKLILELEGIPHEEIQIRDLFKI